MKADSGREMSQSSQGKIEGVYAVSNRPGLEANTDVFPRE